LDLTQPKIAQDEEDRVRSWGVPAQMNRLKNGKVELE
jgi:hypothetical protein